MAQGTNSSHAKSFSRTGIPVRRKVDIATSGASASAGLGLANNSVLFSESTMGYRFDVQFTHHVIQCTVGGGNNWTVQGLGPAGSWDTLPNLAADNAVSAVATGKLWIVDSTGFQCIAVVFGGGSDGKASIASSIQFA